tara:strand:- start:458 stop:733 length:276 start_codon:yes stop_codon:yes gene_type:complete
VEQLVTCTGHVRQVETPRRGSGKPTPETTSERGLLRHHGDMEREEIDSSCEVALQIKVMATPCFRPNPDEGLQTLISDLHRPDVFDPKTHG